MENKRKFVQKSVDDRIDDKVRGEWEETQLMNKENLPESSEIKVAPALKRLLSVEEAATYIGLSPRTLYNAVAPKSKFPFPIRAKRIGKLVRFDIRDLDKYVDSL